MSAAPIIDVDFGRAPVWPCGAPPLGDLRTKLAQTEVALSADDASFMDDVVASVHRAIATPHFRRTVLASAPAAARLAPQRVAGIFSGFDFHLSANGPKLIEINTNAGGAFYGALIDEMRWRKGDAQAKPMGYWAHVFVQHFRKEWELAGKGRLGTVAIVDDAPDTQFLRLEFHLAARFLHEAGIHAIIADSRELAFRDGRLWYGATPIDLVYNRLTSFALEREADAALREALLAGAVVVTPDPRAHALLACKRNLALLGDEAFLREAGVEPSAHEVLMRAVPRTVALAADNAPELWQARAGNYFKPVSGFGSRAVYDGAKLTTKTWRAITGEGGYVAQARVEPARVDLTDGAAMRFDVRTFAYGLTPFMRLARVYRGQTTNFRTPGGGFAPVRAA